MSRVVSIKRSDSSAISIAEFQDLIASDSEFKLAPDAPADAETIDAIWWAFPPEPVHFVLSAGIITVENPYRAALRKMQDVASHLNARVIDGNGDDLTDKEFPDRVTSDGCFRWVTILLVLALAGLAWLVLR
jgi:hypothetical protein